MPRPISELLDRRSDLSTFVVHLTRHGKDGTPTASENLESILKAREIEARSAFGWKNGVAESDLSACRVVCFSETPLEHLYVLFQEIQNRDIKMEPYGLAFTKEVARRHGVNPVWYVGHGADFIGRWRLAGALDALRDEAKAAGFASSPAATILPFVESMGIWPTTGTTKEFSWEREWRHLGDLSFGDGEVALVLCPAAEIDYFESLGRWVAVDPGWSLEKMISKLSSTARRSKTKAATTP